MKLLITGGCGFIGSNFINYYFKDGITIVNLDAMYYCANENNINPEIRSSKFYHLIKGNLQCSETVSGLLNKYNITHIIHFAAQSHVQNSFDDSMQYTLDNIVGTHTLLECCRKYNKVQKIIHVSTDEVYGDAITMKNENSLLVPTNPYAATKAGAEMIAMSYINSYNLPIIITRGNNVYGPNQYPEKLIPKFINLLKANEQVTIQGDGSAKRCFLHIDDTCSAFEIILERGIIGEVYNIGTNVGEAEFTVMEIAILLIKCIKRTDNFQSFIKFIKDRPFNDSRYFISNDKLKALGWEIKKDFFEEIKKLV